MDERHKKEKPCKDHFLLMPDEAQRNFNVCGKCGWKILGGGWYLKPVKMANRWHFDH
jgi:hypothetical protein